MKKDTRERITLAEWERGWDETLCTTYYGYTDKEEWDKLGGDQETFQGIDPEGTGTIDKGGWMKAFDEIDRRQKGTIDATDWEARAHTHREDDAQKPIEPTKEQMRQTPGRPPKRRTTR